MNFSRFKLKKAVVPLGNERILIAGGADQKSTMPPPTRFTE
jgi:hypothetical protein